MDAKEMAARILRIVDHQGGGMFFQFVVAIGDEARGQKALTLPEHPNVVVCAHVSDTFAEAFNLVLPELEYHRANPVNYSFFSDDEGFPGLPLVTAIQWRDQQLDFTTPHWLPLVFFIKTVEFRKLGKAA